MNLLLPDAEKTGKLTSIANAVVREITVDKNTGLPNGCNFVDRLSHREMSVKARVVVLAAGTLESTRLLAEFEAGEFERAGGALPDGPDLRRGRGVLQCRRRANGKSKGVMGVVRDRSAVQEHRHEERQISARIRVQHDSSDRAGGGAQLCRIRRGVAAQDG